MDGCGCIRMFAAVIFPLLKPITVTLFIITFMAIWNDFGTTIYFLNSSSNFTLTLTVYNFFGVHSADWKGSFRVFFDAVDAAVEMVKTFVIKLLAATVVEDVPLAQPLLNAAINSSFWRILSRSTANLARSWLIFTSGKIWMTITTSTANA